MDTDFLALHLSPPGWARRLSNLPIRVHPCLSVVKFRFSGQTPLKPPSGLRADRQMRRPTRQAPKNLPVILAFDGHAADAFFVERPVRKPARIGHHNDTPFARFG